MFESFRPRAFSLLAKASRMSEKATFDQVEKTGHHDSKHGDRALSVIGDQRVTLTEEEVWWSFNDAAVIAFELTRAALEQAYSPEDRQGHSCHPGLGVLPAGESKSLASIPALPDVLLDPRQIRARIWQHLRSSRSHQSQRQPVLTRRFYCPHRSAGIAALLVLSHRQGAAPHLDALPMPGLGHRTNCHGSMQVLR